MECQHWTELAPTGKPVMGGGYCARDSKKVSFGVCRGCGDNPNPTLWPLTVSAKPLDPSVQAHIRQQSRNCRGCGDSPPEGV